MIKKVVVLLCTLLLVACAVQEEPLTNEDWFILLTEELNLVTSEQIEAWGIDVENFNLQEQLNKDFIMSIIQQLEIDGIDLTTLAFHPSNECAKEILLLIVGYKNNPKLIEESTIEYKDTVFYIDEYQWIDGALYVDLSMCSDDFFYLGNNQSVIYRVVQSNETEKGYKVSYEEVTYDEVIDSMKLSGSMNVNIDQSYLTINDSLIQTPSLYQGIVDLSYQFKYEGYSISLSTTSTSISAYISKNVDGINYYTDIDLSNISLDYSWDYQDNHLTEAFFKLAYESNLRLGLSKTNYIDKYTTLNVLSTELDDTLIKQFQKINFLDHIIPLAKLSIPIPQTPTLTLDVYLNLHIYANGSIELRIENQNEMGFEIKDGQIRMIHEQDHDLDFSIKANGNTTLGLEAALSLFNYKLMNIETDLGVAAVISPIIHLYDDKDEYQIIDDLDAESISMLEDPRIAVCADLSLNWIGRLTVNTSSSVAGKLGLDYQVNFLDENNQILNNESTHMENWQFVDYCTKTREYFTSLDSTQSQIGLSLETYQITLSQDETQKIEVLVFPSNLDQDDFTMKCKNSTICEVNDWIITAKQVGTTIVLIESEDERYYAQIHLIVSE
ncbi:MAG: hypothetical protein R3Y57_02610 [Erysipelotrichaceae bacterium]